jgi:hypothetical protein
MLKFEIKEIKDCNIEILKNIYKIYEIFNEDRNQNDYLTEIIIENFYNNIILIYDNNKIVGYTILKLLINDKEIIIIIGDSVLLEKYIGNSIIMISLMNFVKINFNKNKKMYGFWLCNTIYTYLMAKHFELYYPSKKCKYIPDEYKKLYINCLKLFTNKIYDNQNEINLVIKYEKHFGKVKEKYAKIRDNFQINEEIKTFLELNENYLEGDCLCLFCEIRIQDIKFFLNNNKKNRIGLILSHIIGLL